MPDTLIVTAADERYWPGVKALFNSIRHSHGRDAEFAVLTTGGLSSKHFLTVNDPPIHEWCDPDLLPGPVHKPWRSPAQFYYWLAPYLFADYDRILVLDADALVLNPLHELMSMELEGNVLAAIKDGPPPNRRPPRIGDHVIRQSDHSPRVHGAESLSIQTGTVLIDSKRWRDQRVTERCFESIKRNHNRAEGQAWTWKHTDQSILGLVIQGRFAPLEYRWAVFANRRDLDTHTHAVLHFPGKNKPWMNTKAPYSELWLRYAHMGPEL